MAGRFEVYRDASRRFRWRLRAAGGRLLARSESYSSKASAQRVIADIQEEAKSADIVDLTEQEQARTA